MDRGSPTPQRLGAAHSPLERGTDAGAPSRPEPPTGAPVCGAHGPTDEIHLEPHIILSEN